MNPSVFLNCLAANGFSTGTQATALYNLQSGDQNFVFNLLYNTGQNYYNGYPFENVLPLLFNGTGNNPSGVLNGNSPYQVGNSFIQNFGVLMMLQNSGCLYTGNNLRVLVSTTSSGNSGAVMGLTPSNRLFLQVPNYSTTLSNEVDIGDLAFLGVQNNRFVNFGLFSLKNQTFYRSSYDYDIAGVSVQNLYIGGLLNYPALTTGYSGIIKEIYLFNGNITDSFINPCINCIFATGVTYPTTQTVFNDRQITGSYWSGITATLTTGYATVSGNYPKVNGNSGVVYVQSGLSGVVTLYQSLFSQGVYVPYTGYSSGETFVYNTGQILSGLLSNIYFGVPLTSGDIVEVYTYQNFLSPIGANLNYNAQFPTSAQTVQLYGNGLAETVGVDFGLLHDNYIQGYDGNDVLMYDVYPTTITMPYISGYILTGTPTATYTLITGISGVNMTSFNYDIYLNGQKMISGVNYSYTSPNLYVSGNDLADINDPSDTPEFKLIPQFPNLIRTLYEITGTQNTIGTITGFSEQIWLNGLRQSINIDYFKNNICPFCTGFYQDPGFNFGLYSSISDTIDLFNIPAP